MNNARTNWMHVTTLLSKTVIDTIEPLTNNDRVNAFDVDDRMFERTHCKMNELSLKLSIIFSYYILLTLGWTDGIFSFQSLVAFCHPPKKEPHRISPSV